MKKYVSVLFLIGLVVAGCSKKPGVEIAEKAKANFKYIPSEANLIFYCDVARVNASPFAQKFLDELDSEIKREMESEEYRAFKEATGLDPRRDFHSILLGSVLAERAAGRRHAYVIIEGAFDRERIVSYLREEAEQRDEDLPWHEEEIDGHTIYTDRHHQDFSAYFADGQTLYLGPRDWVLQVLRGGPEDNLEARATDLHAVVKQIKYGDELWLAFDAHALAQDVDSFPAEMRRKVPALEKVSSVVFSAKTNDELDFHGQFVCDSPESGQVLVDLMKGSLAAAKLFVSHERAAVDELNKIQIYQQGNSAVLQGEITDSFIRTLRGHNMMLRNGL